MTAAVAAIPGICVETLSSVSAIESIADEWRNVWSTSTLTTPFQHPAWLIPWYRAYAPHWVRCLAVRRDGELIGVVPMCCLNGEPCTVLKIAGAGVSDYLDLIALDADRREVGAALGHWLVRHGEFDVFYASDLAPTSPIFAMETPATFDDSVTAHDACPRLALPGSMDDLMRALPAHRAQAIQRAAAHSFTIDVANEATLDGHLMAVTRLDEACCRSRSACSIFAEAPAAAFHFNAAHDLLREGLSRLYVLKDGDAIICALYTLRDHRSVYYYASGCSDAYRAASPGAALVARALSDAIADGYGCFDFLRCHDPFKQNWGASAGTTFARRLCRHPLRLARSHSHEAGHHGIADETVASAAGR